MEARTDRASAISWLFRNRVNSSNSWRSRRVRPWRAAHGGQAVVRGPARRGGARQQSGHLLVEVRAHGPEQEELVVGERPVLPAAEQAQRPQGLTVADNAVLEGVIDLKGLIALLVDGGAQPLLFPHQVALPEEGGLPAQLSQAV